MKKKNLDAFKIVLNFKLLGSLDSLEPWFVDLNRTLDPLNPGLSTKTEQQIHQNRLKISNSKPAKLVCPTPNTTSKIICVKSF